MSDGIEVKAGIEVFWVACRPGRAADLYRLVDGKLVHCDVLPVQTALGQPVPRQFPANHSITS